MNTQTLTTSYAHDEKIKFAPEEFMKAQIACEFVIDLTKAISRSVYYDPAHPSSKEVKEGLYASFQRALGDAPEIMLTCRETNLQQKTYYEFKFNYFFTNLRGDANGLFWDAYNRPLDIVNFPISYYNLERDTVGVIPGDGFWDVGNQYTYHDHFLEEFSLRGST